MPASTKIDVDIGTEQDRAFLRMSASPDGPSLSVPLDGPALRLLVAEMIVAFASLPPETRDSPGPPLLAMSNPSVAVRRSDAGKLHLTVGAPRLPEIELIFSAEQATALAEELMLST